MPAGEPSQEGARDVLVRTYFEKRPNLVRFFAARSGSAEAAEDLAQDLYLKITSRQEPLDVRAPAALLYRIATNLMLDNARSAQRSMRRETAWRSESRPILGGEEIVHEPAPDEVTISRERLRHLVEAAEALPPQMGRAFRLHKLEGRSQAETARAMGISVKSVEKHIGAALKSLAVKLRR